MADILIIDDSLTVRMDLKQTLEGAGFSTVECATAADARRELAGRTFGLIILDVLLPDADGIDLLAELKRDPALARVPVVLLSSQAEVAHRAGPMHVAADEYVGKPYDHASLVERVRQLLGSSSPAGEVPHGPGPGGFTPRRILAVDDSPTYLGALAEELRSEGYDVVTASSGEQAIELLKAGPVDCILLDLVMPGLSGQETCRGIKTSPAWRTVPVLMLTAREDREATLESFNAGADDYISKSADFSVLRARLQAQLRRKQFEDENRRIREELHQRQVDAVEARAAREAHKLASQWQTTFDAISDGIALLDPSGRVLRANESLARMLGLTAGEITNSELLDFVPDEAGVHVQRLLLACPPETRQSAQLAIEDRWYDLTLDPVGAARGEFNGFVCILSDVTDRKRAEEDLKEAKTVAETANAAKDRFLAVLSHELRTPLTPVLMAVSVLSEEADLPPEVREDISMIRRNVELEVRLIDDLLDLSRIIHGKLSFQCELRDVHVKLKTAIQMCRPDIEAKDLTFGADLQATESHVLGDAGRLQQIFWNLIKNAVKFTPRGGRIDVRSSNTSSGVLRVEVADTGIGIVPEKLSSVFDAFEQESVKVTREFGGLGLGLAISRALVEMHGGTIWAESEGRGRGTTFVIELPTMPPLTRPAREAAPAAPARTNKPRILLVEDHAPTAEIVSRLLMKQGYEVTQAADVQAALRSGASDRFELLISDLGLPDGSGLDVMRELKARQQDLVGIALTGFGMQEDVDRTKQAGFAEHITKPVDFHVLQATIERLMQQ